VILLGVRFERELFSFVHVHLRPSCGSARATSVSKMRAHRVAHRVWLLQL